jgi:hypothetical protein
MHPICMKLSIGIHLDLKGIHSIKTSMYSETWAAVKRDGFVIGISAIIVLKIVRICLLEESTDWNS